MGPEEAVARERAELERLFALFDGLLPDEWQLPLPGAPANWDVRALAAHLAGHYSAQASLIGLRRQANPRLLRFYRLPGRSLRDTVRQMQVGERIGRTPAQLVAELREVGPSALRNRGVAFRSLSAVGRAALRQERLPAISAGPVGGLLDLWFHRLAVCAVTGRPFAVDDAHDGPIVVEQLRASVVGGVFDPVDLAVEGLSSLLRFGPAGKPSAAITLAPLPFGLLASRRRSAAWAREHAEIAGEVRAAMAVLTAIWERAPHRPY